MLFLNSIILIMKIELLLADITAVQVDAIVNAANNSLLGGGGVDGAIHRKGGPSILADCMKIREKQGGCPTGEAVHTTAGNLPAKYVIHTVGPVWHGGGSGEEALLRSCYINSLKIADELGARSVAFPNISTGVYHFPKQRASEIAVKAVKDYSEGPTGIERVVFVCFDEENSEIYKKIVLRL
jgi:O-acetyl-ADP-ribose deacetylase (regulator of RNase III)